MWSFSTLETGRCRGRGCNSLLRLEQDQVSAAFFPGALPATEGTVLQIDNPNVALSAWKRAEDGQGTILRLVEISGKKQTVHIGSAYLKIREAWNCSVLEEKGSPVDISDAGITLALLPFEIKTVRLETNSLLSLPPEHSEKLRSEK